MSDLFDRLQATLGEDAYRLERELGGGGMSQVFLATEVELGRQVVVKVLPPDMAAGVNKERFQREIKLAASLQHPHIVPLLTAGSAEDLIWFVMPYIEGESLREKLDREGEMPVGQAMALLKEVADALTYAHGHHVVHRDIKPDNIMVSGGHAVVTDFGVAKAVTVSGGADSSLTSVGVALGTPAYMSPEQAAADPLVDHRADIYALGAVAYEMLTGRPPFVKQTSQQVLAAHVNENPDPITSHRKNLPAPLADTVMRCLEKRPADRWQDSAEVRQQFEMIATPQSGGMTPTGTAPFVGLSGDGAEGALANTPLKVALAFGGAAALTLVGVYATMIALGLPDWVFLGAVVLLAVGAPIVFITGTKERARQQARTTGLHVATPVGLERHMTWRKALTGGGLAFVALALVSGGYMALRAAGIGPAGTLVTSGVLDDQGLLIVSEFEDRTQGGDVAASITAALRIDLAQSPTVRLMGASATETALRRMSVPDTTRVDAELARQIGQREGAKAIVAGEVGELGSGFVITARLLSSENGDELLSLRETAANPDEMIGAVDRLSKNLRERIGESLTTIRASDRLPRVTTASLEALRLYTRANTLYSGGETDQALRLLDQAIALDSGFAMAHRRVGVMLNNSGREPARAASAVTRAFELRDRLPAMERRLATAYYYDQVERDEDLALDAYASILEINPNHGTALINSSVILRFFKKEYAEAESMLRRYLANGELWQAYMGATQSLAAQGKWDEADSTMAVFLEWAPEHPRTFQNLVAMSTARRRYAVADSLMAASTHEEFAGRARLHEVQGRLAAANEIFEQQVQEAERTGALQDRINWALSGARHTLIYRDTSEAMAQMNEVLTRYPLDLLAPADRPFNELSRFYAATGRAEEVRKLRAEWESAAKRRDHEQAGWDATIALAEGRYAEAGDAFLRANQLQGIASRFLGDAAEAYDKAGMADSALSVYERFFNVPDLLRLNFEFDRLGASYKRAGELYEARGDRENALEYYGRFVDLWAGADDELQPLVTDVRGRIARLARER